MRIFLTFLLYAHAANAGASCSDMEYWDYARWMCMPRPMAEMPMSMLMVHGNGFISGIKTEGTRGSSHPGSTNMLMADYGKSAADHHYLNVELMLTAEKWTMPRGGYPELGQVGDFHSDGEPYLDAQHPHSSPVMGLTFSDTISFADSRNFLNLFFAPRGASTDGPVSFMHRPTSVVNPAAPLSHHVGQDSGHISSTVVGGVFGWGDHRLELSAFNGTEPAPDKADLPMATPDSYAGRLTISLAPQWSLMVSAARIENPEPETPRIDHLSRYSASTYNQIQLNERWSLNNALIYGQVQGEDEKASALNSFTDEFLLESASAKIWGRVELLQRTPGDLEIPADTASARWISAWTLGYTHHLMTWNEIELDLGASVTKTVLPVQFQPYYGGNPLSEAIFLQIHGMKMFEL